LLAAFAVGRSVLDDHRRVVDLDDAVLVGDAARFAGRTVVDHLGVGERHLALVVEDAATDRVRSGRLVGGDLTASQHHLTTVVGDATAVALGAAVGVDDRVLRHEHVQVDDAAAVAARRVPADRGVPQGERPSVVVYATAVVVGGVVAHRAVTQRRGGAVAAAADPATDSGGVVVDRRVREGRHAGRVLQAPSAVAGLVVGHVRVFRGQGTLVVDAATAVGRGVVGDGAGGQSGDAGVADSPAHARGAVPDGAVLQTERATGLDQDRASAAGVGVAPPGRPVAARRRRDLGLDLAHLAPFATGTA